MRLPVAVLIALLTLPASAQAGTVALEGTLLVFRADPGERVVLASGLDSRKRVFFDAKGVRPGPGCAAAADGDVECPPEGVTGVAIVTGDGNDAVAYWGALPVTLTLAGGDDTFHAQSQAVAVDAGPGADRGVVDSAPQVALAGGDGDDRLDVYVGDRYRGPMALDGGPGNDVLTVRHDGPYATLPGGLRPGMAAPVTVVCGPGADRWSAGPYDLVGDGCAPTLTGVTTATVSRAFREGALTAAASGTVTLWRLNDWGQPRERIAQGAFGASSGPLGVSLRRTRAGRERLRRTPRLPVVVSVRTRNGAEWGEVRFNSRIGR